MRPRWCLALRHKRAFDCFAFLFTIMASNLNYKQVTNVTRRTWDAEAYEKRAEARQQELQSNAAQSSKRKDGTSAAAAVDGSGGGDDDDEKEEFRPAAAGSVGPEGSQRAFLKARSGKVSDIDSRIGTTEMVSAEAAARTKALVDDASSTISSATDKSQAVVKTGIGWHCKVCDCFLKDSHTYLDHINGRKHQSKLGYSMRVERSTKQDLAAKLSSLVQKKEEQEAAKKSNGIDIPDEETYYNDMVKAKDDELERRKEERRRKRQERKNKTAQAPPPEPPKEDEEEGGEEEEKKQTPEMDPAMAAMMGFSGFGGGKKNR
jgi:U4/U6.U5 tri-snRNP component SNU23